MLFLKKGENDAMSLTTIYYDTLVINNETCILAATEKGLAWAGSFNEDFTDMENWFSKKLAHFTLEHHPKILQPYQLQFKAYFQGTRKHFDFPLNLHGTSFQLTVWNALGDIPYGETRTYADIAKSIGNPKSIRAVGTAIGRNPVLIAVPCHRVINKNGGLGGFRGGLELKQFLLKLEDN